MTSAGGTTATGGACSSSAGCLDGATCIALASGSVCLALCDAEAAVGASGSCPAHSRCASLAVDGAPLDYGACVPGCVPYVPVAESGCNPASEWCVPDSDVPDEGKCFTSTGTSAEGGVCGVDVNNSGALEPAERCAPGLFCMSGFDASPRCVLPCDPDATTDDAGHCTNVSGYEVCQCLGLTSGGAPLAFGAVIEGCVYQHGGPRAACQHWGTCVAGELSGAGATDRCQLDVPALAPGDDCTSAGLGNLELCAPFGVCLDTGASGVLCSYYCAASAGALGSTAHPDCHDDSEECFGVPGRDDLGACLPPL
ncbi:MAG: hypothetical protein CVU56_16580 [Deltaproteobacteria bacterium HGW-Deltaproteobacteria-14]|nr:MAG: hypothetical protein CVU56_16580 [Deltaproteobacteria bacterium HGW-Deltaproteobacteria-14]